MKKSQVKAQLEKAGGMPSITVQLSESRQGGVQRLSGGEANRLLREALRETVERLVGRGGIVGGAR